MNWLRTKWLEAASSFLLMRMRFYNTKAGEIVARISNGIGSIVLMSEGLALMGFHWARSGNMHIGAYEMKKHIRNHLLEQKMQNMKTLGQLLIAIRGVPHYETELLPKIAAKRIQTECEMEEIDRVMR